MAEPKIVFNQSAGSDTLSSGAGPGDGTTSGTAINGVASAHTSGAASTTISLPAGTDLTNVLTDGSHAVYLVTASGRRFSKITAKSGSGGATPTITVADSFTIASPGVDWAIGGKRSTLEHSGSRQLGADYKGGWIICVEDDGLPQVLNSQFEFSVAGLSTLPGWMMLTGASKSSKPLIRGTHNGPCFNFTQTRIEVRWFRFDNTSATKGSTSGIRQTNTTSEFWIYECEFGDQTNTLQRGISSTGTPSYRIVGCEFKYLLDCAIDGTFAGSSISLTYCNIHHCAGSFAVRAQGRSPTFRACRIWANTGKGIELSSGGGIGSSPIIDNCTIDGNGSHGIDMTNSGLPSYVWVVNNQITNNGGYGINVAAGGLTATQDMSFVDRNNFYNNTSGARNRFRVGDTDYAVNPDYVDRTIGDFRTQEPSLQGKGYADATTMAASRGPEIGSSTYAGSGGGSSGSDIFSSPVIR